MVDTQMREKIALAQNFAPMSEEKRHALIDRVVDRAGKIVAFYKAR